ncbi:zinc finger and BTB domain-containing protein 8B-like [Zerene cesonia]|uniref:zinc finger and BTB domain-containing protein 8B-like n=1 Tax=Zerene cesonia TaxID=33412 RepID=UPI0018E4F17C|nr:zinc finger and BTB domain-containing protein 8B-like [Zerene cesonia]
MSNQEISLKWNGYQNNILYNVKELFKDEGLSDVTLVSDGQSFKAHKVILSANSTVFRTIFQQNPHKDPIIVLHDINTNSLRTLLTFMYNGEVNVTEEFLPVLLKTAETLRICGLSTGSESNREDDIPKKEEKSTASIQTNTKKRKKSEHEDNNNKVKRPMQIKKSETTSNVSNSDSIKTHNITPKIEPIDSPLTDYSGENTNDTDIAVLEDNLEKKYSATSDTTSNKSLTSNENTKKWINEVSSTQPCLNTNLEKDKDEKDIEIDKEVETVLQSGTIVESLNIATENMGFVSNEHFNDKDKSGITYANPSFPCPFCPRVYNSWGYRRRHVKSRHMTNRLSCKWCVSVLPSTGAWYSHATKTHGVPHEEARNSLVVMVEAHAVLTLNEPSVAQLLGQVGMDANGGVSEKNN